MSENYKKHASATQHGTVEERRVTAGKKNRTLTFVSVIGILVVLAVGAVVDAPWWRSSQPHFQRGLFGKRPASRPSTSSLLFETLGEAFVGENEHDNFGSSISLSHNGTLIAIGADQQNGGTTNLKGFVEVYNYHDDDNDNSSTGRWSLVGKRIRGRSPNDRFGHSVALAGKVNVVAIGAPQDVQEEEEGLGYVQVFHLLDSTLSWVPLGQTLSGENEADGFGHHVALSNDGKRLAVAASNYNSNSVGYVKVFFLNDTTKTWVEITQVPGWTHATDLSISLSGDGRRVAWGDPNDGIVGRARVMDCSDDAEVDLECEILGQEFSGPDYEDFTGASVSLSDSGRYLAIGAPGNIECAGPCASVRVYEYGRGSEDVWSPVGQELFGNTDYGRVVRLSGDGLGIAVETPIPHDPFPDFGSFYPAESIKTQYYQLISGDASRVWQLKGDPVDGALLDLSTDGSILVTRQNESIVAHRMVEF